MRWTVGLVLAMAACSGDKGGGTATGDTSATTPSTASTGPATLHLSFDLEVGLISQMDEPAAGTFQGSVFAEADASALGPNDGATALVDFESDPLDYGTEGGVLSDKATVGPIDAQIVWILGCLDSDANGCELHDPITVPNENKFQVLPGDGEFTLKMSLLNPS